MAVSLDPTETDNLLAVLTNPSNTIVAHLAKNPIATDADTLQLSDLVESTFPGYSPIPLKNWEGVDTEDANYGEAVSELAQWICSGGGSAEFITAVYLTLSVDGGAPVLLQPYPMEAPVLMDTADATFARVVRYRSTNLV